MAATHNSLWRHRAWHASAFTGFTTIGRRIDLRVKTGAEAIRALPRSSRRFRQKL